MDFSDKIEKLSPEFIKDSAIFPEDKKHEAIEPEMSGLPSENKWEGPEGAENDLGSIDLDEIRKIIKEGEKEEDMGSSDEENIQVLYPPVTLDPNDIHDDNVGEPTLESLAIDVSLEQSNEGLVEIPDYVESIRKMEDPTHFELTFIKEYNRTFSPNLDVDDTEQSSIWIRTVLAEDFENGTKLEFSEKELEDPSERMSSKIIKKYLFTVVNKDYERPTFLHPRIVVANRDLGMMVPSCIFRSIDLRESGLTPQDGLPLFGTNYDQSLMFHSMSSYLQRAQRLGPKQVVIDIVRPTEEEGMKAVHLVRLVTLEAGIQGIVTRCSSTLWRVILSATSSNTIEKSQDDQTKLPEETDGNPKYSDLVAEIATLKRICQNQRETIQMLKSNEDFLKNQQQRTEYKSAEKDDEILMLREIIDKQSKAPAPQKSSRDYFGSDPKAQYLAHPKHPKKTGMYAPGSSTMGKKMIMPSMNLPSSSSSVSNPSPRSMSTNPWVKDPSKTKEKEVHHDLDDLPRTSVATIESFSEGGVPLMIEFLCDKRLSDPVKKTKLFSYLGERGDFMRLAMKHDFNRITFT